MDKEILTDALKQAQRALRPFAGRVFYDNGDCTVSDTHTLVTADFLNARNAALKIAEALKNGTP